MPDRTTFSSSYAIAGWILLRLSDGAHAVGDWFDTLDHELDIRYSQRDWAVAERARRAAFQSPPPAAPAPRGQK